MFENETFLYTFYQFNETFYGFFIFFTFNGKNGFTVCTNKQHLYPLCVLSEEERSTSLFGSSSLTSSILSTAQWPMSTSSCSWQTPWTSSSSSSASGLSGYFRFSTVSCKKRFFLVTFVMIVFILFVYNSLVFIYCTYFCAHFLKLSFVLVRETEKTLKFSSVWHFLLYTVLKTADS